MPLMIYVEMFGTWNFTFSNSLIIHEKETKGITIMTAIWIPDLN